MFWSKVYRVKDHVVVAICDKELINKKIDFHGVKVHVSEKFYGGEIIDEEKAIKLLENSTIGNLIGEKIVNLAIKRKYVDKKNTILIGGIPHAQFIQ